MTTLPNLPNTNMPNSVDSFVDPKPSDPTAYGTSTDHALEHDKENDAITFLEDAVVGVTSSVNTPGGLSLLDMFGRLTQAAIAPNVSLYAYGHSGMLIPGAYCTSGAEVLTLSNARLSALSSTSYAVSRSRMLDVFFDLLGGYGGAAGGAQWPTAPNGRSGRPGVVIIDAEKEDFYNPTNTAGTTFGPLSTTSLGQVANFQSALLASVALIQSSSRLEHTAGTASGTGSWTTNNGSFSGGSMVSTTTQGETYTFSNVTVPASGTLWVLGYVTTSATGDTSIAINGTIVATATTGNAIGATAIYSQRPGSINNPSTYQPQITQVSGLTPGANVTVAVSKSDSSSNPIYFDCILVPAQSSPMIILPLDNLGNNTYPAPTSPVANWSNMLTEASINKPYLDKAISNVLSTLNQTSQVAASIDLGYALSGIDLSYITGNDLNDRGMRKFSDLLTYAIGNWCYRNDPDGIYKTL